MKSLIYMDRARTAQGGRSRSTAKKLGAGVEEPNRQSGSKNKSGPSGEPNPFRIVQQTFTDLLYENDYRHVSMDFDKEQEITMMRNSVEALDLSPRQIHKSPSRRRHLGNYSYILRSAPNKQNEGTALGLIREGILTQESVVGKLDISDKKRPFHPVLITEAMGNDHKLSYADQNLFVDDKGWMFQPYRSRRSAALPTTSNNPSNSLNNASNFIHSSLLQNNNYHSSHYNNESPANRRKSFLTEAATSQKKMQKRVTILTPEMEFLLENLNKLICQTEEISANLKTLCGLSPVYQQLVQLLRKEHGKFKKDPNELAERQSNRKLDDMDMFERLIDFAAFYNASLGQRNLKTKLTRQEQEKYFTRVLTMTKGLIEHLLHLGRVDECLFIVTVINLVIISFEEGFSAFKMLKEEATGVVKVLMKTGESGVEMDQINQETELLREKLETLERQNNEEIAHLKMKLRHAEEDCKNLNHMIRERNNILQSFENKGNIKIKGITQM